MPVTKSMQVFPIHISGSEELNQPFRNIRSIKNCFDVFCFPKKNCPSFNPEWQELKKAIVTFGTFVWSFVHNFEPCAWKRLRKENIEYKPSFWHSCTYCTLWHFPPLLQPAKQNALVHWNQLNQVRYGGTWCARDAQGLRLAPWVWVWKFQEYLIKPIVWPLKSRLFDCLCKGGQFKPFKPLLCIPGIPVLLPVIQSRYNNVFLSLGDVSFFKTVTIKFL